MLENINFQYRNLISVLFCKHERIKKLLTSKIRKMSNIHKCIKVDFKEKSFVTLCSKNHAFNQLDKEGLPDQF